MKIEWVVVSVPGRKLALGVVSCCIYWGLGGRVSLIGHCGGSFVTVRGCKSLASCWQGTRRAAFGQKRWTTIVEKHPALAVGYNLLRWEDPPIYSILEIGTRYRDKSGVAWSRMTCQRPSGDLADRVLAVCNGSFVRCSVGIPNPTGRIRSFEPLSIGNKDKLHGGKSLQKIGRGLGGSRQGTRWMIRLSSTRELLVVSLDSNDYRLFGLGNAWQVC
jgi:hypothetical protein